MPDRITRSFMKRASGALYWFVRKKDQDSSVSGVAGLQGTTKHSEFWRIRLPST